MATLCLPMKFCDVSDQRTSSQALSFMFTVSIQYAAVLKAFAHFWIHLHTQPSHSAQLCSFPAIVMS